MVHDIASVLIAAAILYSLWQYAIVVYRSMIANESTLRKRITHPCNFSLQMKTGNVFFEIKKMIMYIAGATTSR